MSQVQERPRRKWPAIILPAALLLLLAAPAMAQGGEAVPFDFGTLGQAIASLVIFGLLVWILGRWAWGPVVEHLRQREQRIADTIADADKRRQDAEALLQQYKARLDQAQDEIKAMLAQSRQEAAAAREQILQRAQADAQRIAEQMRQEIDQGKRQAFRELYDRTTALAAEMASQILQRTIRPEDHKGILQRSLSQIESETKTSSQ